MKEVLMQHGMSEHDADNVQFLLNIETDDIFAWFDSLDDDDYQYAMEILEEASKIINAELGTDSLMENPIGALMLMQSSSTIH